MATQNQRDQSAVKLANHNVRYNCIVISFFGIRAYFKCIYIGIYIYIYTSEKKRINMTDGIRSLLINCSHLKELFILSNITFNYQSYLKIYFQFLNMFGNYK